MVRIKGKYIIILNEEIIKDVESIITKDQRDVDNGYWICYWIKKQGWNYIEYDLEKDHLIIISQSTDKSDND